MAYPLSALSSKRLPVAGLYADLGHHARLSDYTDDTAGTDVNEGLELLSISGGSPKYFFFVKYLDTFFVHTVESFLETQLLQNNPKKIFWLYR